METFATTHTNGQGGGLPPRMSAEAAKAVAAAAGVDTSGDDSNSFGDLLSELLRTLPSDAAALFLRSLSGLSPSESHDFCDHVSKLKPQKQFRVIHAMSEATVDGKRRFLQALAKKIKEQQAKQQVIQAQNDLDIEAHVKRKEAMQAKERVKAMNPAAKFHSFDASRGAGVAVKENMNGNATTTTALAGEDSAATTTTSGDNTAVGRSWSSSSLQVTKEDIKQVGRLLSNSHITESEQNLRELEVNKKAFATLKSDGSESIEMGDAAKRDRPDSIRELVKHDEKPLQRTRSEDNDTSYYERPSVDNDDDGDYGDGDDNGDAQDGDDPDAPSTKRWTKLQDNALRESVRIHGEKNWKAIAELVPGRNHAQCLQRWRKVLKPGLVKGHWSFEEDQILEYLVTQGCNNWGQIAERIPGRTPKQCRERWKNHLDPAINKGPYTEEEDKIILDAQAKLGNKWSQIAQLLQGRTEDSVKIRWKSLKQNPAKAAASHAQQKKAQQQQHHHSSHAQQTGSGGYQQNPAMLRQRQLQMLQQQQHLQHSEAAQLEHHQQMQQQQLQLRLQERLMQQQMQRQAMLGGNNNTHDLTVMKPDPSLSVTVASPVSGLGMSMAGSHLYSPAGAAFPGSSSSSMSFTSQLTAAAAGLDPAPYDFNVHQPTASYGYDNYHAHQSESPPNGHHHHRGDDEASGNTWDVGTAADDGFARLGENPPPASFWDNYPKHPGMLPEPIPLAPHGGHHDPSPHHHGQYGVPEEEVVYDDAMFEKLATELGTNSLHFAPI